jgi:4-carboxymuconolactone decarboxylase
MKEDIVARIPLATRDGVPEDQRSAFDALVQTRQVGQATFEAALAQFGVRGLVELTNLMGYYALLAFNVNAFGVELPHETSEAPLPI